MFGRALTVLSTAVVLLACGGNESTEDRSDSPSEVEIRREPGLNVLLITVDTLRADALGSYGNTRAVTPWMDRLAAEGVRFENARAHNVVTLPTHASILTGLYPQEHGVRDNSGFRLRKGLPTLATILRKEGYRTGAFVSAFPLDARFGLDAGFEVYEDSFVGAERRPAFYEQERSGSETVALARTWIDTVDPGPWLCWVHLYEPHFPYDPPQPLRSRFSDDLYLGDVAAADEALAPLLEPLLKDANNRQTLVVLTSDHGEALGEHGEATHGIFAYESTLRVPLILYQSDLFESRVVLDPVRHIDLLPTILDALGLAGSEGSSGRSLLPVVFGQDADEAPSTYFESLSPKLNRGWAPLYGIVDGDMKYIELPIPELYNLEVDPGERTNLAATEPERVTELRGKLAPLRALDPGSVPASEDEQTIERLRSLGYLSGSPGQKKVFSKDDDPKTLIDLDAALRDVVTLYGEGDLTAALERARQLVQTRPGMRMALLELAHLEREMGNLTAAVDALREAWALNPADTGTLALLGAYLTQAGKVEEALAITEANSELAEPDVDVLLVRALALARSQQGGAAFSELDKARRVAPDNPMVPVHQGTLHLLTGDRGQAKQAFNEALALHPTLVAAHTALGMMAIEENEIDVAVEHWHRAVTADPQQSARLLTVATQLWNQGRTTAARPLLELFVASAPADRNRDEIERIRGVLGDTH